MRSLRNMFVFSIPCLLLGSRAASAATCTSLTSLQLPDTTITLAQSYAAGDTVSGTTKAPVGLCRVAGTIKPGKSSNIHFEVWIPTDGSWNGNYQQIGNGGFAGSISLATIANGVSRGYATAGTDDGTSGPPAGAPSFIGNTDVLFDYGFRAIKVTTDDSKAVIQALTGNEPGRSYFVGCSDGGREALKEAQQYPEDFDGIIVGSPVNDQVGEFGSCLSQRSEPVHLRPGRRRVQARTGSRHLSDPGPGRCRAQDLLRAAQPARRAALPRL